MMDYQINNVSKRLCVKFRYEYGFCRLGTVRKKQSKRDVFFLNCEVEEKEGTFFNSRRSLKTIEAYRGSSQKLFLPY